ncbi:MAG: type I-F CRISPR-associated endoribonuclease Cas6/Csy4 [Mariprofundaceae bacterium]|nr:type I-F CRISPR-associated endoribonuclease Cas6/Csy4 [Mariprofundaceae bacterium]
MNYYFDIQLKPDATMRENILLNQVYTKLHQALSSIQATDIGVSFPHYKLKLGNIVRLHSTETRLIALQTMKWLGDLEVGCDVSEIQQVPDQVAYRVVSRKQSNMTEAKLRRLIKRGSISQGEVRQYKSKMFSQGLDNPYLELESSSNGHHHRRFIQFSAILDKQKDGLFDQFGLSKEATVPIF